MPKTSIIFCNGNPGKFAFDILKKLNKATVISADGASNYLYKHNVIPNFIIGDLDSISDKVLEHYKRKKVTIKKNSEQEDNDLEKALNFALKIKSKRIFVAGYSGERSDHFLNNFSVLLKYSKKCKITFVDDLYEVFIITKKTEFKYPTGEVVSLFGFPVAKGVRTNGLKFALHNENLILGQREGALNISNAEKVSVSLTKGYLLVFKRHFRRIDNTIIAI